MAQALLAVRLYASPPRRRHRRRSWESQSPDWRPACKFATRQSHQSKLRPIARMSHRPQTGRPQPPRAKQQSPENPHSQNQRPPDPARHPKPSQQPQTRRQEITTDRHPPRRPSPSQQKVIKMRAVGPERRTPPRHSPRHHQQRIQNRQRRNHEREEQ